MKNFYFNSFLSGVHVVEDGGAGGNFDSQSAQGF
jgi:hypothetical protein